MEGVYQMIDICFAVYFRKVDGRVRRKAKAYGLEPELSRRMFRYRSR